MKMRKGIFNLLFCTFVFLSLPVLAGSCTTKHIAGEISDYGIGL